MDSYTLALLILGFIIGFAGGAKPERWQRTLAIIVASSLPVLAMLLVGVSDIFVHGYDALRFRRSLGLGLALAVSVTPIWIAVGFLGSWIRGRISRRP